MKKVVFNPLTMLVHFYQWLFYPFLNMLDIVLVSGRNCTKTTTIAMVLIMRCFFYKDADAFVYAYEKESMADKIEQNFRKAFRFMFINNKKYKIIRSGRYLDRIFIYRKGQQDPNVILFKYADGLRIDDQKQWEPTVNHHIVGVWFSELTTFKNFNFDVLRVIKGSLARNYYIVKDEFDDFYSRDGKIVTSYFYDYNIPRAGSKQEFVYDVVKKLMKSQSTHYQFNNYLDMSPKEFDYFFDLGSKTELENSKKQDYETYEWEWEGKRLAMDGAIFTNFSRTKHFTRPKDFKPTLFETGGDYGEQAATALCLREIEIRKLQIDNMESILFLRIFYTNAWYHSNRKHIDIRNNVDYSNNFTPFADNEYIEFIIAFLKSCHDLHPNNKIFIQYDFAGAGSVVFRNVFKQFHPYWLVGRQLETEKFNKEQIKMIIARWRNWFSIPNLFYTDQEIICKAIESAEWHGDKWKDAEDKNSWVDMLDAMNYCGNEGNNIKFDKILLQYKRSVLL